MALWFAGSICSLLAHCVGTGSTLVLPLGYGFLALMGGSGGEERERAKKGWWDRNQVIVEREGMEEKERSKRKSKNNTKREKYLKSEEVKQSGKSRKRKTMRGVAMSSYPHLAACGRAGMLWSGRRGLMQPFLSSWSGNASLPLAPLQAGSVSAWTL